MFKKIGLFVCLTVFYSLLFNYDVALSKMLYDENNQVESAKNKLINEPKLDESEKNKGSIKIKFANTSGNKMKIGIKKDSNNYYYNFKGNANYESFPLQSGSGKYKVTLFENTRETKYKSIKSWTINVKLKDENSVYLNSIKLVNWKNTTTTVSKAKQLTNGLKNDEDKAKAIYDYIVSNIKYDSNKAKNVKNGYVPNIDSVIDSKLGICYDFASTYAGMLRSIGIPAKLVMGNSSNVKGYHAWNEVFINGRWVIVDTSYDSQAKEANVKVSMCKSSVSYKKIKQY
ncbi:transglutaminase-like domain-containing protein [Clostridium ganghwense]|uniref:Transglutaminase-like domain-containing protein n=1 Tax=Clostridium ganghwense TaxID=312089 RepID=A0ABT4CKK1_9CLOT|nr:transglutaminase-like domain-containing protein [Clostridium ganghwense]MCY6369576.1 transglutaminase-like domain-containing protein [Clostridium ganghwense]